MKYLDLEENAYDQIVTDTDWKDERCIRLIEFLPWLVFFPLNRFQPIIGSIDCLNELIVV